jgi:hypothetical protein
VAIAQVSPGGGVQTALPSAQREKCAQQPTAAQPQVPGSTNTEWQSGRASHDSCVVMMLHAAGHAMAGQMMAEVVTGTHAENDEPPLQFGQRFARQSERAVQEASSVSAEHGGGQTTPLSGQEGGGSLDGS